jgi:hypothetical protein
MEQGIWHLLAARARITRFSGVFLEKLELSGSLNDKHRFWLLVLKFISGPR